MTATPESPRALAIMAHPDDADFGAGGTLATWVDEGFKVTLLLCTRGDQGGLEDAAIDEMPVVREREQRAASAIIGITDVRFLDGYRDGWLEPTWELQRELVRVIRQVRPHRILCQSPERWYDRLFASHPDHLAAGEAAIRAIYPAAENPHAWPELLREEGLAAYRVPEIWLMAHPNPNHAVDITDVVDRKIAALRAHESQTGHMGDALDDRIRGWGASFAAEAGLPKGRVAELFKRIVVG